MWNTHPHLSVQLVHDRQRQLRREADAARLRRKVRERERPARYRPQRRTG